MYVNINSFFFFFLVVDVFLVEINTTYLNIKNESLFVEIKAKKQFPVWSFNTSSKLAL